MPFRRAIGAIAGGIYGYNAFGRRGIGAGTRLGYGNPRLSQNFRKRRGSVSWSKKSSSKKRKTTGGQSRGHRRRSGGVGRTQDDAGRSYFRQVYRSNPKWMRGFKKMLAPRHLMSSGQTRITVPAVSQQRAANVVGYRSDGVILGNTDFADMFTNLTLDEPSTTPTIGATTRRLKVNFVKAKYTMKNQTNIPVEITWYDIVARRDQDATAAAGDPIATWNNGMQNEQGLPPGANTLTSAFPGATPFMSEQFCMYWKVKRVVKFMLGAGSNHVHEVKIKPAGLFNRELTTNSRFIRGVSYVPIIVVKGGIVQDTTTPFNVAYSTAEVDIICDYHAEFQSLEKSRTIYTAFTTLPAAVTTQGTILEDTDAVAVVSQV